MRAAIARRAWPLVFVLAACGHQADPCAEAPAGSCLTLEVSGPHGAKVDKLVIDAFGEEQVSNFGGRVVSLPVRVGVVPPAGLQQVEVDFEVTGLLDGSAIGRGTTPHQLTADDHAVIDVVLSPGDLDMGAGADMNVTCTPLQPAACSADGSQLLFCNSTGTGFDETKTQACSLGCASGAGDGGTGEPHCQRLLPHLPANEALLYPGVDMGLGAITLTDPTTIDTDQGTMSGVSGGFVFKSVVVNGQPHNVFVVQSLTLGQSASVVVVGASPLVIIATSDIVVNGVIDARPHAMTDMGLVTCPGGIGSGGGFAGGTGTSDPMVSMTVTPAGGGTSAGSPGNPAAGSPGSGASGGGNAGPGGYGAAGGGNAAVQGGVARNIVYPMSGGGGGGPGPGSSGGGGGGVVQLVAAGSIRIEQAGNATTFVGINASGCAGAGTFMDLSSIYYAPAGGGAGGAIVLEAPSVTLGSYAALTANGGGGGGGKDGGVTAALGEGPPAGGPGDNGIAGAGGAGGGGVHPAGGAGAAIGTSFSGGGGGGAAGYTRVFDADGTIAPAGTAALSPTPVDGGATFLALPAARN